MNYLNKLFFIFLLFFLFTNTSFSNEPVAYIDIDFWKSSTSKSKNDKILFIGNDGKRDYKKVVSIANCDGL